MHICPTNCAIFSPKVLSKRGQIWGRDQNPDRQAERGKLIKKPIDPNVHWYFIFKYIYISISIYLYIYRYIDIYIYIYIYIYRYRYIYQILKIPFFTLCYVRIVCVVLLLKTLVPIQINPSSSFKCWYWTCAFSTLQAETRAEFAERSVAKLEKTIDDLEGKPVVLFVSLRQCTKNTSVELVINVTSI